MDITFLKVPPSNSDYVYIALPPSSPLPEDTARPHAKIQNLSNGVLKC